MHEVLPADQPGQGRPGAGSTFPLVPPLLSAPQSKAPDGPAWLQGPHLEVHYPLETWSRA